MWALLRVCVCVEELMWHSSRVTHCTYSVNVKSALRLHCGFLISNIFSLSLYIFFFHFALLDDKGNRDWAMGGLWPLWAQEARRAATRGTRCSGKRMGERADFRGKGIYKSLSRSLCVFFFSLALLFYPRNHLLKIQHGFRYNRFLYWFLSLVHGCTRASEMF